MRTAYELRDAAGAVVCVFHARGLGEYIRNRRTLDPQFLFQAFSTPSGLRCFL